ncbi:hypothetical protein [Pirellula sp. SH-Sr6A]|uniref:hypothetical protein n=1 Tax=Pirellula sp. SH-Sr6A TaxID=1632865 RepID=UPI0011BAB5D9|nr:hypothetical protein [Pirellula sp. SH-Sr6A]
MTQFVILRHEYPAGNERQDHWDLLLEPPKSAGEAPLLLCFAIPSPIKDWAGAVVQKLPDHRRLYLHYEGPISGDRGLVRRIATGEIEWIEHSSDRVECILTSMHPPVLLHDTPLDAAPTETEEFERTSPSLMKTLPYEWSAQPIRCRIDRLAAESRADSGIGSFHPADPELDSWRLTWQP